MLFEKIPYIDKNGCRLLITGGSGFIGTAVISHQSRCGAEILNLDIAPPIRADQKVYWREQDIMDMPGMTRAFAEFKPTHVLHLAARADLDEEHDISEYATNIEGTENVLRATAQSPKVRTALITSTMFVCEPGYQPVSDTDYRPHTLYGRSKIRTEELAREANLSCAWAITRPAMIWGPYHERMRAEFFRVLRKGLYFHPGNTGARRSYGYVGNTAWQISRLLEAPGEAIRGRTFYLGDPPVDLFSWANEFSLQVLGRPVRRMPWPLIRGLALAGDALGRTGIRFPMTSFRLDNMTRDNIVETGPIELLVKPLPYSVADGVRETVAWLQEMGDV
jgi:nucleoside-diphosphate-sugar epimerase